MLKYLYDFLMIKVCINKLKKLMNQKNKRSTSTENNYDKMRELRDYFNPEILQKCPITVLGKIEYRNLAFKYSDKNKTLTVGAFVTILLILSNTFDDCV